MRSRGIACARKAGWLWCRGFVYVYVVACENTLAARLARNAHEGVKIVSRRTGDAGPARTAVAVAIEHMAFVVDRDLVEVEQVAVLSAAALLPDAGHALDGIVGRGVDRCPRDTAVVSDGDERIRFDRET